MKKFKDIFIILLFFSIAVILHSANVYADTEVDKSIYGNVINYTYNSKG